MSSDLFEVSGPPILTPEQAAINFAQAWQGLAANTSHDDSALFDLVEVSDAIAQEKDIENNFASDPIVICFDAARKILKRNAKGLDKLVLFSGKGGELFETARQQIYADMLLRKDS